MNDELPLRSPDALARQMRQRAYNRDGLPEIAAGVTFLLIGVLMGIQQGLRHGSLAAKAASLALSLLTVVAALACSRLVQWMRGRFLLDRVGYVKTKPAQGARRWVMPIAAAMAAVAVVLLLVRFHQTIRDQWIVLGTGLLIGFASAAIGRMPRFVVLGAAIAIVSLVIASGRQQMHAGFAWLYGFAGVAYMFSGTLVLGRLLHRPTQGGV